MNVGWGRWMVDGGDGDERAAKRVRFLEGGV
jgi:hypothetical protein